jgi:dihydroorotate dehydrogenase (NAD+) catalytic subunit
MNSTGNSIPSLAVSIGGLNLKNPVMPASGTFGYGEEYAPFADLNRLGAVVTKGISLRPRAGNPPPRIMETPAGMLNAVGLQNVGVRAFVAEKLPYLRRFDVPVIVNIFGEAVDEYAAVAEELSKAGGVHALEVNISCPNVKKGGIAFGARPESAAEVTAAVRGSTDLPVIVKLTPNVTDIVEIALAVEAAGAHALSLINRSWACPSTWSGASPSRKHHRRALRPAVRPVAVRMVWQVARRVKVPSSASAASSTRRVPWNS